MQISGRTRVFMVVGDPIAQVQAPLIFNSLFERHGVDAVLVPAQVQADRFENFARAVLGAGNIDGLWLTIPHKPALLDTLEHCDRAGRLAQSVNAVRKHANGGLEGGLFDGSGFVASLHHFGFEPRGQRALLVGAGGAGAAIAVALLEAGVRELAINDLGPRGAQLAARLAAQAPAGQLVHASDNNPAGFDLIVNATPLGLRADDPLPIDVTRLSTHACVVDILMKATPTPLLRACADRGITAHPGFEMLVQQVPDYLDFFGLHDAARATRADLSSVRATLAMP